MKRLISKPAYRTKKTPAEAEGASREEAGGAPGGKEGAPIWEEDTADWTEELRKAFEAFMRGRPWAGAEWEVCVTRLVSLEKAWGYPAKGLLAAPNSSEERPGEVEKFMRYGRKWGTPMELASEIGPREMSRSESTR